MRHIIVALLAGALAIASVGATVQSAEAGWQDGWYMFTGKTASKTRTFYERTPARTKLVVALQKKAGAQKCRARVIVKKGGYVWRSQYLYKYSRTKSNAFVYVAAFERGVRPMGLWSMWIALSICSRPSMAECSPTGPLALCKCFARAG